MGQLRRPAIIVCVGLLLAQACAARPDRRGAEMVTLRFAQERFVVKNTGSAPVELRRKVLVERKEGASWLETAAEVYLIASCAEKDLHSPLHLGPGDELVMAPWNGWGCDGQCPRPCRANYYLGPGAFRFVVFTADGKKRFDGPEFALGAEDPRQKPPASQ